MHILNTAAAASLIEIKTRQVYIAPVHGKLEFFPTREYGLLWMFAQPMNKSLHT